jgi:hypothetical protein
MSAGPCRGPKNIILCTKYNITQIIKYIIFNTKYYEIAQLASARQKTSQRKASKCFKTKGFIAIIFSFSSEKELITILKIDLDFRLNEDYIDHKKFRKRLIFHQDT